MINGMDLFSSHLPARPSHAVHRLKKFQLQEYWCSWDRVRSKTTEQTLLFTEDLRAKSMQELLRIYPRWTWDRFGRLMWSSRKWMWSPVVTILTCATSAVSADTKPTHHYFCFPLFKLTKKIKFSFKRNLSKWREKQPQVPDWIYTTSGDSFKACSKAIVRFLFNRWRLSFPEASSLGLYIERVVSVSGERRIQGVKGAHKKTMITCSCRHPVVYLSRRSRGKQWIHSRLLWSSSLHASWLKSPLMPTAHVRDRQVWRLHRGFIFFNCRR